MKVRENESKTRKGGFKEGGWVSKRGPRLPYKTLNISAHSFLFLHRWRNLLSVRAHHTFYVHINIERAVKWGGAQ